MFTILLIAFAGLLLITFVYVINTTRSGRGVSDHDGRHHGVSYYFTDSSKSGSAGQGSNEIQNDSGSHADGWDDSSSGAGSYDGGWGDSGSGGDGGSGGGGE